MKVETPATLKLSIFVCPSKSESPFTSRVVNVETPAEFIFPTKSPVILPETSPVKLPMKLGAVTIPVALIFPTELIPTPFSPASTLLPTWKV